MTRALACGLVAIGALALAPVAYADVISDEEGVCRGKAKGDACEVGGKAGSCVESTCTFNDYSNGPPPKAGQRPCLQCAVGAEAKEAKAEATPAKTDGKEAAKTDAAKTDASKSEAPPAAKSGCSIDGMGGAASIGVGIVLLGLARRARRRS